MSVSVVLPTTGRSPDLRRAVEGLLRSATRTGPDAEVLVVVNGRRSVPTLERLGSPMVSIRYLERANVARARNVGIAEARHDTVLFGDDGGQFPPTWCADLATALRDPLYPAVTAPVRVPVTGPVTAFLDHQRFFDAPPVDAIEARTVTGNCGIRRDRLPADVRYDERNLPQVAEDVAFGHAIRRAGLKIRWLADAPPGRHLLPERIEELTGRALRYGRGAALFWSHHSGPVASPAEVIALYRWMSSAAYAQYRRFTEVLAPSVRAAFTVYDYLYDVAYLVGYLDELGSLLEHTFVELDADGLGAAWREIADRAAAYTGHLGATDWASLRLDFRRLDAGGPTHDTLVAEVRRSLLAYAPLRTSPATAGGGHATAVVPPNLAALHAAWQRVRAAGDALDAAMVNAAVREIGLGFREACAAIERAGLRRAAQAQRAALALAGEGS